MTSISLLREKFIIRDTFYASPPVEALGNRLIISLPGRSIPLVIRGHSMHMTLRFGAEIMRQLSYISQIEKVAILLDWDDIWAKLANPFEADFTPSTWITVYYKGEPIYHHNAHHMFFDILEQCEYKNSKGGNKYETSLEMTRNAFKKLNRDVMIDEESHVGFILDAEGKKELRFAIILRIPGHRGTFITRLSSKTRQKPALYIAMAIAADYIEAINMAVRAGFIEKNMGQTPKKSKYEQVKQQAAIIKRLDILNSRITQAEARYTMLYRPERPDFQTIRTKCSEL